MPCFYPDRPQGSPCMQISPSPRYAQPRKKMGVEEFRFRWTGSCSMTRSTQTHLSRSHAPSRREPRQAPERRHSSGRQCVRTSTAKPLKRFPIERQPNQKQLLFAASASLHRFSPFHTLQPPCDLSHRLVQFEASEMTHKGLAVAANGKCKYCWPWIILLQRNKRSKISWMPSTSAECTAKLAVPHSFGVPSATASRGAMTVASSFAEASLRQRTCSRSSSRCKLHQMTVLSNINCH